MPGLEEGRHRVEASLRDDAGREGSAILSFTVDTTAPKVTVLQPAQGAVESSPAVDVSGVVAESAPVRVTVAGVDAVVSDGSFRAVGVPLGQGPEATLAVVARDAAGNTSTANVHLRLERRPPAVSITSPANGARVGGAAVRVKGAVRGAGGSGTPGVVDVNGRTAIVEGETFEADIPLPTKAGNLVLRATARSAAGLVATDTAEVAVDTGAPELVVDAPRPGTAIRETSVRVSGRVDDPAATVRVNGAPAPLKGDAFSARVPLPAEGPQTILVTAEDATGNRTTVELPVRVDRTPPALSLLDGGEGSALDPRAVSLYGFAEDAGAISVTVDGVPAERLDRAWRADLEGLTPGRHAVDVVARDEAGNETRARRTVTVRAPTGPTVVGTVPGVLRSSAAAPVTPLARAAQAAAALAAPGDGSRGRPGALGRDRLADRPGDSRPLARRAHVHHRRCRPLQLRRGRGAGPRVGPQGRDDLRRAHGGGDERGGRRGRGREAHAAGRCRLHRRGGRHSACRGPAARACVRGWDPDPGAGRAEPHRAAGGPGRWRQLPTDRAVGPGPAGAPPARHQPHRGVQPRGLDAAFFRAT